MPRSATLDISLPRAHAVVIRALETRCWNEKMRRPYRHAGEVAQTTLASRPLYWRIYRAGIAAGLPSEYQRHVRRQPRTPRQRAWAALEQVARTHVAQSDTPLTLRSAVLAVLQTPEGQALYRAYRATPVDRRPPLRTSAKRAGRRKAATRSH